MFSWLSRFAKNPRVIGSVAPSSPALAQLMTQDLDPGAAVLELGPGNGAITALVLPRLSNAAQLTMIEVDPDLAAECRKKFPGANVICADAEDVLQNDAGVYDAVLSGIPFAVMQPDKRDRVFRQISNHLKPDGVFVMFQYSKTTLRELKDIFSRVEIRFTPWNVPPAYVFFCRR